MIYAINTNEDGWWGEGQTAAAATVAALLVIIGLAIVVLPITQWNEYWKRIMTMLARWGEGRPMMCSMQFSWTDGMNEWMNGRLLTIVLMDGPSHPKCTHDLAGWHSHIHIPSVHSPLLHTNSTAFFCWPPLVLCFSTTPLIKKSFRCPTWDAKIKLIKTNFLLHNACKLCHFRPPQQMAGFPVFLLANYFLPSAQHQISHNPISSSNIMHSPHNFPIYGMLMHFHFCFAVFLPFPLPLPLPSLFLSCKLSSSFLFGKWVLNHAEWVRWEERWNDDDGGGSMTLNKWMNG